MDAELQAANCNSLISWKYDGRRGSSKDGWWQGRCVMSDMEASSSATKQTDQQRIIAPVRKAAAYFALNVNWKTAVPFVAKVLCGGPEVRLCKQLLKAPVRRSATKPPASRSDSSEKICALPFKRVLADDQENTVSARGRQKGRNYQM